MSEQKLEQPKRIKDEGNGSWYEDPKNLIETKYSQYGNKLLVQPYLEEVVKRIRQELLEDPKMAKVMKKNPQMFTINSAWRTKENQDAKFKDALKKAKDKLDNDFAQKKRTTPPTKKEIKELAKTFVAEISAHHTGATLDWYLGYPPEQEHISDIFKSKAYKKIKPLLQKYKMAPYNVEPWHWECSSLCKKNIESILAKEKASEFMVETDINDEGDGWDNEKNAFDGYEYNHKYYTNKNLSSLNDDLIALGNNPIPMIETVEIDTNEYVGSKTEDVCQVKTMDILLEQQIREESLALSRRNKILAGVGIAAISATILGVWLYNRNKNQS